ncbi:MAG: [acyl-carrier-protein] S-malonyltransferase [Planctomycetota bacterium]|nr:MAG: [acyl-carrier-protein] S-malonyltransferase [Planctomycetota bacterium]
MAIGGIFVTTAFLFPGQGAQKVGMGKGFWKNFPKCKEIFEKASQKCPFNLLEIIFEGPQEKLNLTAVSQPAILTVSYTALEAMKEVKNIPFDFAAGLSLGEYTALLAAEAIEFEPVLELVIHRGQFMQEACDKVKGGMASIMGLDRPKIEEIVSEVAQEAVLSIANYNSPKQIVISGEEKGLAKAEELLKKAGARRVIPLQVAGAYHSPLMEMAQEKLAPYVEEAPFQKPKVPVISNVTAGPMEEVEEIKQNLIQQVTSSVRWSDSMEYFVRQGMNQAYEIGPGTVLKGLMRQINREVKVNSLGSPEDLEQLN